jgi:hypothetical protein
MWQGSDTRTSKDKVFPLERGMFMSMTIRLTNVGRVARLTMPSAALGCSHAAAAIHDLGPRAHRRRGGLPSE